MSLPRQIVPGRFYMITRRCTQRQFLLRPDQATNNNFTYCLAEAANRYGIEVILVSVLSNHHHTIVFDRRGTVIEFVEHLHKFIAKSQNALRGRWENLWASEPVSLVHLVDAEDVMDKLVYAATNPVKDGLVERVHHWPGVNGLGALLAGRRMRARRPGHFFRADGCMPESVELELEIPSELGEAETVRAELRARVAEVERLVGAERAKRRGRVMGRRAVLRQSWNARPTSCEPRRGLRPRVAARNKWSRIEALQRDKAFVNAYREARRRWCDVRHRGDEGGGRGLAVGDIGGSRVGSDSTSGRAAVVVFPYGTYWLRRFAGVSVAGAASG